MDSVKVSMMFRQKVGPWLDAIVRDMADMVVARKAAVTADSQSSDLATISQTVTSTMSDLKTRSARALEHHEACSSRLLSKVRQP